MAAAHAIAARPRVATSNAIRFVPADCVPVTVYLPARDVQAIEESVNTTDIVGVVTALIRQQLLQQPATGPEASRLNGTKPQTVHVPQAVLRRLPDTPGAFSDLLAALLDAWLNGKAVTA